jgi:hypothetical protein
METSVGSSIRWRRSLPRLTPELIAKYDTDGDGKIDIPEQAQIMHEAAKEARTQFRRFDLNADDARSPF